MLTAPAQQPVSQEASPHSSSRLGAVSALDASSVWLDSLRAENTRHLYRHYFEKYLEYTGKTADQLLEERISDVESRDILRRQQAENQARRYIQHLEKQAAGYSLRLASYTAIRSFYDFHATPLQLRRRDHPRGDYTRIIRPPTKTEIRSILQACDPQERSIILLLKDTGLAVGDAARLRVRNFQQQDDWRSWLQPENTPIPLRGSRRKTGVNYHTFIGPETTEALHTYWTLREKGTRHLDSRGKGVPAEKLSASSHVFRAKTTLNPIGAQILSDHVHNIISRTSLQNLSAHSFRRYFRTTLEAPDLGIHPAWLKRMMGHKLGLQERAYSHPTDTDLEEAYRKAMPALSVLPRHVDEERLKTLEQQNTDTARQMSEMEQKMQRYERMLDLLLKQK